MTAAELGATARVLHNEVNKLCNELGAAYAEIDRLRGQVVRLVTDNPCADCGLVAAAGLEP